MNQNSNIFTNSLMKTIICSISVHLRLMAVLHKVLDMTHLMEYGCEIFKIAVSGAHLDPEVLSVIKVPGSGMANDIPSISWFLQHAQIPK